MRSCLIIWILVSTALISKGQKQESDKIYWTALEAYTHYHDTAFHDKGVPHIPPVANCEPSIFNNRII
jgi:hypothetical protein